MSNKKTKVKESVQDRMLGGIITFLLSVFAIICALPLVSVLSMSFSSKAASDMNAVKLLPVDFTFDSWRYILSQANIWRSLGITVLSTVIGVVLALLINGMMAYPLSKKDFRPGRVLMIYVVITMIFQAPIVPYFLAIRGIGLYDSFWVLVLPHILSAYNMAIMRTFFKQLPAEMEDAAKIDGCGYFRIFFSIIMPCSKAVLATLGLFYGVAIWNQFQNPLLFINSTGLYPLQLRIRQLINNNSEIMAVTAKIDVNYSEATLSAALVVFAIIPIIIAYPWLQKYFAKGAMLGSVKG